MFLELLCVKIGSGLAGSLIFLEFFDAIVLHSFRRLFAIGANEEICLTFCQLMLFNFFFTFEYGLICAKGFNSARFAPAISFVVIIDTAVMLASLVTNQVCFARGIYGIFSFLLRGVLHLTLFVYRMIDNAHILALAFLLSLFGFTMHTRLAGVLFCKILGLWILLLFYAIFVGVVFISDAIFVDGVLFISDGFLFLNARLPLGKSIAIVVFTILA